jgi:hypothetical protein
LNQFLPCLLLGGVAIPIVRALIVNRHTSLNQAVGWAGVSCIAWAPVLMTPAGGEQPWRYAALCLTGAAGVAVLGARHPYVGAWNFVILGLLAVLLLPLAEDLVLDTGLRDPLRMFFMASTIAVGVINYLPTRLWPAALLVGFGCGVQMFALFAPGRLPVEAHWAAGLALACVPWAALLCWLRRPKVVSAFDELWLEFRDRYGWLWGQRLREQFNHAARHAGWPVTLAWRGLTKSEAGPVTEPGVNVAMLETLKALLRRFMPEDV